MTRKVHNYLMRWCGGIWQALYVTSTRSLRSHLEGYIFLKKLFLTNINLLKEELGWKIFMVQNIVLSLVKRKLFFCISLAVHSVDCEQSGHLDIQWTWRLLTLGSNSKVVSCKLNRLWCVWRYLKDFLHQLSMNNFCCKPCPCQLSKL